MKVWKVLLGLGAGAMALVVLSALVVCGYLASLPDGSVHVGSNMRPAATQNLANLRILEPGERVRAYYDNTMVQTGEDLYIVTDSRAIRYLEGVTTAVKLADVTDIDTLSDPVASRFRISTAETTLVFEVAPFNGADLMEAELRAAWKNARKGSPPSE